MGKIVARNHQEIALEVKLTCQTVALKLKLMFGCAGNMCSFLVTSWLISNLTVGLLTILVACVGHGKSLEGNEIGQIWSKCVKLGT